MKVHITTCFEKGKRLIEEDKSRLVMVKANPIPATIIYYVISLQEEIIQSLLEDGWSEAHPTGIDMDKIRCFFKPNVYDLKKIQAALTSILKEEIEWEEAKT